MAVVIMGPSSGFLLVLIGITFISTHAIPVPDTECPPDQVYNECGSACYSPCGERDPDLMCTDQCVPGCFCKPGFTFLEGSNNAKCVPCNPTPAVPKCPLDQVYNECGSACYSPCGKRDSNLKCPQQCVPGCFCKPGFKFLEGSNETKCVPCNQTQTVPECPPDQVYNGCGSACYSPCGERDPDLMCTDQCVPGCFCKPGFTFLEGSNNAKCVPCNPTPAVPDTECPPDQEYDECRSPCYSPCGNMERSLMCPAKCVPGCFCKPGFTFLEGSNKTKCVPCNPTHTVPECPPDQVYDACRSACYSPCGGLEPDQMCTDQCVSGCFCKPGFTFLEGSDDTKCVPCNPTHTVPDECPPDQVYNECGSACYSPCGIMSPHQMCTQQCVPGCFCKPGFAFPEWGDKTRCVPCKFTLRG